MKESEVVSWFDAWTAQLAAAQSGQELRPLHRWLWSAWVQNQSGPRLVGALNAALQLPGDDRMRPDVPHLFAGRPEDTDLLFVNINPGWAAERNRTEDGIVAASEEASWSFCRALFTRYPREVGRMNWWSQSIGIAWRVVHGSAPTGTPTREKQEWADARVSGWELLPIHSTNGGFLNRLTAHPAGRSLRDSMKASLGFALRCGAPVTIIASSIGSALAEELAAKEQWRELKCADTTLPVGSRAFVVHRRLVLAIPRQLVSKYSGTKFDDVAFAVRNLRDEARK